MAVRSNLLTSYLSVCTGIMQVCHFQHLLRQFDKNEPGRFLGEGVAFRAKLIGVLEVPEARGDRMCQEALADLKMAIRAAGEHKQRIQVHVAIDGLRLRDDKTGDSLYHHPVHKISFIAQDMTDSRAFGYIFGSPDTGHRFFGIKTDKAASQVVIAMRDLFQVVFELKKKEVEMAKQQLEGKSLATALSRHVINAVSDAKVKLAAAATGDSGTQTKSTLGQGSEGVADLVDLEQELCSLRRGLSQVEGLTPSTDPFGDSFILPASQKGLLPPPPSGSSTRGRNTPAAPRTVFSPNKAPATLPFDLPSVADFEPATPPSLVDNITEPPELKNPPKKVLKDLVPAHADVAAEKDAYGPTTTMTSLTRHSGGSVSIVKPQFGGTFFSSDPFAETDPFDNTDPFSDSFKDDPFTSMQEFAKGAREEGRGEGEPRKVFNGPLQVSLPPEPAPKSPRLHRQATESSSVRQRPTPSSRVSTSESASPPPPLPPKKVPVPPPPGDTRPPVRPPQEDEPGPPLPRPARKKEPLADRTIKPRLSSLATSSEDEYLTPAPPPLPTARRFDITLSQLLTCSMDELASRLRVPTATLSSMTLPQLTDYLRSYLAADNERAHIHVDSAMKTAEKEKSIPPTPSVPLPPTVPYIAANVLIDKPAPSAPPAPRVPLAPRVPPVPSAPPADFQPQFEDNFAPSSETSDTFVANFDDFDKKVNPSYDRYAAFREIQEQELNSKSILDPIDNEESKQDSDGKEELTAIDNLMRANQERENEVKETSKSPLKSLDELTLDSFNMFRNSVSPKPSQIEAKIEDIKSVMKSLQLEKTRGGTSPRDNGHVDLPLDDNYSDRYAALREITITEPSDEFESIPPEVPKERKRSDEKSDGFDNSDFFDCIDNSSLSFTHVEDAFRKSPSVREKEEEKRVEQQKEVVVEMEVLEVAPVRELAPATRLSAGSISDVISGSSPDTKEKCVGVGVGVGGRWAVLSGERSAGSSDSRDSEPRPRLPHRHRHRQQVQTSSSSRDASPWDEEPPAPALRRDQRDSRHNSSGSRECLDSGSGREKDKLREKQLRPDRDRRDSLRNVSRDRSRPDPREHREHRERRDRRSREREGAAWGRERGYRERDYRDSRSRDPPGDYRDKERDPRRKRHPYDDEEEYSDGCGSGRSSPRERWQERWRRDERNYGSLGWRETRRRAELRQTDDPADRRYGSTLAWVGRRTSRDRESRDSGRESRESRESRDSRDTTRDSRRRARREDPKRDEPRRDEPRRDEPRRDEPRRDEPRRDEPRRDETRRDEPRRRDYRFSSEFSPRDTDGSPFEEYREPPTNGKKRPSYSNMETTGTRFAFEPEEASPAGRAARFRPEAESLSPRSLLDEERAAIAEEDEPVPPLRAKPANAARDIKKSESVNIFTRDSDPFENDAFFACTGSDRAAKRDNWPADFHGFDDT